MKEAELMRQLSSAEGAAFLRVHGVEIWRRNVGAGILVPQAWASSIPPTVRARCRWVRFGERGQADFSGWCQGGRVLEVEAKSSTGRPTPEQREWGERVQRAGGVYVVARSLEDVIAAVRR